ncbi:hypothetical protein QTJ16_003478 [Diplocarpon rosae]|uniref:Major facilitator superfamily (MFS) profile domain-containing protein n=1 Tax=Diplocarpon rosae TaxID=946125 RepID=A0AAD9WDF4_9HELO|nr:hypothetical protein QTJ16_003478 [Diplocarpon rosae]
MADLVGDGKIVKVHSDEQADSEQAASGSKTSGGGEGEVDVDVDLARIEKVYRKIDRRIIPAFWALYFLCSAIRSNIGLAQTMNTASGHNLMQRLDLSAKQTSTALALFYVAYVVFNLPSSLVMTKLSPRVWMARTVFAVGLIGACFAAVQAAWSLLLLRSLLGVVIAGLWPGMSYYLTLFYPPSRTGQRIGYYFTASQVSAAVVGLVSAGFQEMDGLGGLVGFQWMFLLWGLCAVILGPVLLWWLPDRPLPPGEAQVRTRGARWMPASPPILKGEDAEIHYRDLTRVYHPRPWNLKDLVRVIIDWRLWPLIIMYFGVVGVGLGVQLYSTVIISGIDSTFSGTTLSLLSAPIWIMDLIAILLVTPISDRFHHHRALIFSLAVLIQVTGLLTTTFAPRSQPWARYGGLLLVGFGLGPTVPICMTWGNEIFQQRHGEVGVAAAAALISGLGNLGSVVTTYALYTGWPADAKKGPTQYRKSNLTMVGILAASIASSVLLTVALKLAGEEPGEGLAGEHFQDGAARRERQQRGFGKMWWSRRS